MRKNLCRVHHRSRLVVVSSLFVRQEQGGVWSSVGVQSRSISAILHAECRFGAGNGKRLWVGFAKVAPAHWIELKCRNQTAQVGWYHHWKSVRTGWSLRRMVERS